jgi:DNA-binding LacI/PurR family transcriptional regulator
VPENIYLVASGKNGVLQALNYLKSHGCNKIFFVGTLTEKNPIASERLENFRKFCQENSMDFDRMHRSVSAADVESVLPHIVSSGADGVFCASETFAFRLGKAMHKHGIRIPEDISLMGMEAEELNTSFDPPITAIRQDFEKLAQFTVDALTQAIEKRNPVKNIRVPYTLIERSSVRKKD